MTPELNPIERFVEFTLVFTTIIVPCVLLIMGSIYGLYYTVQLFRKD